MKLKYFPASNVAPPSSPYHTLILESWDPYLEVSQMFLPPEGHRKFSNVMTIEQFYSHILNVNKGSLHSRCLRHIHFSTFR